MLAVWAPWLLRLEGLGLTGLGAYLFVRAFGDDISSPGLLVALALITLGAGVLLGVASRMIGGGRQWPQAPVIFLQVCAVLSGAMMIKGSLPAVGVPLILLAILTLGGVVSTRSLEHPDS